MTPKEGRYTVKHVIHMADYENVTVEHSLLFDIGAETDTVESAFADARSHIDKVIKSDLERAAQCTAYGDDGTYIHSWVEEVYTDA